MKHKCRDYQAEDVEAIMEAWGEHRSTLYVAATGLGKTFVMAEIVERRLPKRALLLAHRKELIWQARDAFLRREIEVEVEMGELSASTSLFSQAPVVVATVQTMASGKDDAKRMLRFNPMEFGTLLYDESHHSVSAENKKIVEYFTRGNPDLKVLGVTATPDRADEEALGQIFECVAAERDILFGVNNGWLIEPEQLMVHVGGLDFSHMRTTAGDLNGADLSAAMESESAIAGVAMPTLEAMFGLPQNTLLDKPPAEWGAFLMAQSEPRRTIIFTVSVSQAEQLSNILNRVVPGIASWLCGKTSDGERSKIFSAFGSGCVSALVNCGVTTEGYDNPAVEIIAVARPTKSRSLYAQMIGRGTRPLPGIVDGKESKEQRLDAIASSPKPKMLVMDFVGNSGRHKLVTTADILGGNVSDEAIEAASNKAKKTEGKVNMKQLLEEEEQKLIDEKLKKQMLDEARKARLVAKVKYTSTRISPFEVFELQPTKSRGWDNGKTLSEKQSQMLMKQGIDPRDMSYSQGKQLINEMFRRWTGKLATLKQCALLNKHGYKTKDMTMKDASAMIDALAKNGWKRRDFDEVVKGIK
jgi:hypothetical protein